MLSKQHGHQHSNPANDGHAVQPVLLRETSAVESIVATLKPLAAGSTRRIEQQYRRISEGISYLANARNTVPAACSPVQLPDVDGSHDTDSDSEVGEGDSNAGRTGQPDLTASIAGNPSGSTSKDGANNLVWSSWDILPNSATVTGQPDDAGGRRVLITVYTAGLSIWDIQDANEAKEIFNLSRSPVKGGHVTCARLVPSLRNRDASQSSALKDFPLLAILTSDSAVSFYSLSCHKIVTTLRIPGNVVDIQLNEGYLVAACVEPAAIRIYSLQSLSEECFSPISDVAIHPKTGTPVYTLSRSRLLAYASTSSLLEGSGNGIISAQSASEANAASEASIRRDGSAHDPSSHRPASIPIQISSETARKVGEGMLSGMKAITDYGYARYRSSRGSSPPSQAGLSPSPSGSRFSKSAPQPSYLSTTRHTDHNHREYHSSSSSHKVQRASPTTVVVVDLVSSTRKQGTSSTSGRNSSQLRRFAHFKPSKSHPITLLSFNPSGTQILTSSSEGHAFHIFELRSSSFVGSSRIRSTALQGDNKVWHRYRLNRGLTPADAVQAVWSQDSRFVSVTTSRGTAHLFPLLPGGGKPGIDTHLSDKVVNMTKLMPLSVSVHALVRIKAPQPLPASSEVGQGSGVPAQDGEDVGAAHARLVEPPSILFMPSGDILHSLRPASSKSAHAINVFAFYPHLANLVYSRISLSSSPKTAPASAPLTNRVTSQAASGITQMMRSGGSLPTTFESEQLLARENKVAYYPLGRGEDWKDVLLDAKSLSSVRQPLIRQITSAHQAEIETFSRSRAVLPRSIYLSPSFTFHHYPPNAQPTTPHPLTKAFSLGNFSLPSSCKRLVVRNEVYHTHRYPLSEAAEGEELRSAMHTILDSASYNTTPRKRVTDQNSSDPDDAFLDADPANSPAFPNGYGKTSSPSSFSHSGSKGGGWGVPLPIPILPRGIPIKATTQSLTRSMERMSKHFAGSGSQSPRLLPRSDRQQATSLSFEDENAVFAHPSEATYAEGKRRGSFAFSKELYDVAENETAYESSSVPPLSIDAGSSAESRSAVESRDSHEAGSGGETSPGTHPAPGMPAEGRRTNPQADEPQAQVEPRDEWEAWKLDGIDEEDVLQPTFEGSKTLKQTNLPLAIPSVIEASQELEQQQPERTVPLTKAEMLLGVSPSSSSNASSASSYEAGPGGMLLPSRPTSASSLGVSPVSTSSAGSGNKKKNKKNGRK